MDETPRQLIDDLAPAISGSAFVAAERMRALSPRAGRLVPPTLRLALEALSLRTLVGPQGFFGLRRDVKALADFVSEVERALCPVKICGLSTPETMAAALDAGVDMIGLNFHPKSPRRVSLPQGAALAVQARGRTIVTALVVDAADAELDAILRAVEPDVLQLHGTETPERCQAIAERFDRPVMKALGVATATDLDVVRLHGPRADRLLLDAKPPPDAAYPGGHGRPFDWTILKGLDPFMPFMLSGGLTPENVGEGIRTVRGLGVTLAGVDVSSGVESAPGVKDADKIKRFIAEARQAASS